METLQDKISDYIAGKLTGEDLQSFEKQLQTDTELAAEVALYHQLRIVMQHSDLIDMNKTLNNIRQSMPQKVEPDYSVAEEFMPKGRNWRWWGIGLVVIALLAVGLWQYQVNQKSEQLKTFTNTLLRESAPFENIISIGDNDYSPLAQGMKLYDAGKYIEAIPYLEQHNNSRLADDFSKLYLGICYLMTEKADKTISLLLPLSTTQDPELSSTAQWHLALAYLQDGKKEKALPLLKGLSEHVRFGKNVTVLLGQL